MRNADAGSAISAIGDINGDNFADFAVGAPGHTNEEADEGRVVVFYAAKVGFLIHPVGVRIRYRWHGPGVRRGGWT